VAHFLIIAVIEKLRLELYWSEQAVICILLLEYK